jgi:hypothetical protein
VRQAQAVRLAPAIDLIIRDSRMNGSGLIFLLLAPFGFWAAYSYHDRHRPETTANLVIGIRLVAAARYL